MTTRARTACLASQTGNPQVVTVSARNDCVSSRLVTVRARTACLASQTGNPQVVIVRRPHSMLHLRDGSVAPAERSQREAPA